MLTLQHNINKFCMHKEGPAIKKNPVNSIDYKFICLSSELCILYSPLLKGNGINVSCCSVPLCSDPEKYKQSIRHTLQYCARLD